MRPLIIWWGWEKRRNRNIGNGGRGDGGDEEKFEVDKVEVICPKKKLRRMSTTTYLGCEQD